MAVYYTYEDDDRGWKVECEVEATVVPFHRATMDEPPDGGYVEDVTFLVSEFKLEIGGQMFDMPLTAALQEVLSVQVKKAYDDSSSMQDEIADLFLREGELA